MTNGEAPARLRADPGFNSGTARLLNMEEDPREREREFTHVNHPLSLSYQLAALRSGCRVELVAHPALACSVCRFINLINGRPVRAPARLRDSGDLFVRELCTSLPHAPSRPPPRPSPPRGRFGQHCSAPHTPTALSLSQEAEHPLQEHVIGAYGSFAFPHCKSNVRGVGVMGTLRIEGAMALFHCGMRTAGGGGVKCREVVGHPCLTLSELVGETSIRIGDRGSRGRVKMGDLGLDLQAIYEYFTGLTPAQSGALDVIIAEVLDTAPPGGKEKDMLLHLFLF
ncbi:hypothetical protein JZ751_026019 [Albula glossodonta]|uniref:Uncharacterized protein n=1 Tax=Albula glossodonta TaxID=121402 RepID=A0A8T2N0Z5_9TELE|nr:hypothetical protein JZ751_026019 [Albula glossodonta]